MKIKKPTRQQLAQMAMYIQFGCRIQSLQDDRKSLLNSDPAYGIIGSRIITQLDEDDIQGSSDISHPKNDERIVLRQLFSLTKEELHDWYQITKDPWNAKEADNIHQSWVVAVKKNGRKDKMFEGPMFECVAFVMFCVERHIDCFGLIEAGQAFDADKGK